MTYMNLSGQSVKACLKALKLTSKDVLVIYDELDLDVGCCKLKFGGGSGGHNGIESISGELGTDQFYRLRLGIGKPIKEKRVSGADWVLTQMPENELKTAVEAGVESITAILEHGAVKGTQIVNTRVKEELS
jgi:PTH1 family peptidyl-tRNA hydrolase